jgi:hypothetical protein
VGPCLVQGVPLQQVDQTSHRPHLLKRFYIHRNLNRGAWSQLMPRPGQGVVQQLGAAACHRTQQNHHWEAPRGCKGIKAVAPGSDPPEYEAVCRAV